MKKNLWITAYAVACVFAVIISLMLAGMSDTQTGEDIWCSAAFFSVLALGWGEGKFKAMTIAAKVLRCDRERD